MSELTKTNVFSQSGPGGINSKYYYDQRFIDCLIFFIYSFPHLLYYLILFFVSKQINNYKKSAQLS